MKYKNVKQIHYKNIYNYFIAKSKQRSQLWRSRQKTKARRRERLKLLSNADKTKDTAPDEPQDKEINKNRVQDVKAKAQGEIRDMIKNPFEFKSSSNIKETSNISLQPSVSQSTQQHAEVTYIRNL